MHSVIQIVALQATLLLSLIPQVTDAQAALATECWIKKNGSINQSIGGPCGIVTPDSDFTTCCGIGHICFTNGLCKNPKVNPSGPANVTGYYIGGCTDQSYGAPSCRDTCSELVNLDIVYNSSSTDWSCCGALADGSPKCTRPTTKTFEEVAPKLLTSTYVVRKTVRTAAPTGTSTPPNEGPTESGNPPGIPETASGGLSTGAKAGIGIGAAIGALAVLGCLGFFFMRRRNRLSKGMSETYSSTGYAEGVNDGKLLEKDAMPAAAKPQEKFSERQGEEILGNGPRYGEIRQELP